MLVEPGEKSIKAYHLLQVLLSGAFGVTSAAIAALCAVDHRVGAALAIGSASGTAFAYVVVLATLSAEDPK